MTATMVHAHIFDNGRFTSGRWISAAKAVGVSVFLRLNVKKHLIV
jgi:hypothetical protein